MESPFVQASSRRLNNSSPNLPPCWGKYSQACPENMPNCARAPRKSLLSPTTTLICNSVLQSAVRRLVPPPHSKTCAHCSASPAAAESLDSCLPMLLIHTHTCTRAHAQSGRCVSETSVKPNFWLDCHVLRAAAFS